ncbi:hypothetical protein IFM89_019724 [Coptis chinensis]|uniref:Uncharacterized protein n=1 Tax=Coptis chinensis TaxID=261450 RepID=A0A835H780_9MAGN|nr:hypothetical protein IFM89_019724 [Coptis chinensis]
MSSPVRNPNAGNTADWRERYIGMIDYSAIILWVLVNAELTSRCITLSAGSANNELDQCKCGRCSWSTSDGCYWSHLRLRIDQACCCGCKQVASGIAAEKGTRKDGPTAASSLGRDFYNVILQEEPLKSTTVKQIIKSFGWALFLPDATVSSGAKSPTMQRKGLFDYIAGHPIFDFGLPFTSYQEVGLYNPVQVSGQVLFPVLLMGWSVGHLDRSLK